MHRGCGRGMQIRRHPRSGQVACRVVHAQVPQPDHPQQLPPPRVREPALAEAAAPGDHHQRVVRETGHELLAQPVIQRLEQLVGVDQDNYRA